MSGWASYASHSMGKHGQQHGQGYLRLGRGNSEPDSSLSPPGAQVPLQSKLSALCAYGISLPRYLPTQPAVFIPVRTGPEFEPHHDPS